METALLLRLCIVTPAGDGVTVRNSSSRKVKYSQAAAELHNCKKPSMCWEGGVEKFWIGRGGERLALPGWRGSQRSRMESSGGFHLSSTYLLLQCCLRTELLNSQFTIHMYIIDSDVFRVWFALCCNQERVVASGTPLVNEHRSNDTESLNIKRWRFNLQNLLCTESLEAVSDEGDEIHSFLAHFPSLVRMCKGCHLWRCHLSQWIVVHTTQKYIANHKSKGEAAPHTTGKVSCQCVRRQSHLSFSLLSPTVESVMHGPSDRRYLLLFE